MGVYIRGMEMPKPKSTDMATVYGAYVLVSPNGYSTIVVENEEGLDTTYHLISIPPHGKLIDRDAARGNIKPWSPEDERNGCTFDTVKKLMYTMLDRAPTIIPAEPSEEQREYEAQVEAAQYCEMYEPTYDPETGAL